MMNDDLWWSDTLDVDGKVLGMAQQCHITLVDFGFARALSPNEIDSDTWRNKITMDHSDTSIIDDSMSHKRVLDLSEFLISISIGFTYLVYFLHE
jgi:hypothetical protein